MSIQVGLASKLDTRKFAFATQQRTKRSGFGTGRYPYLQKDEQANERTNDRVPGFNDRPILVRSYEQHTNKVVNPVFQPKT